MNPGTPPPEEPAPDDRSRVSPARLRVGVVLVFLWWIPVWLAAPLIAEAFGLDGHDVLVALVVVQTFVGLAGVLVIGRQVARIMTGIPARRMLPTVWRVFRRGTLDGPGQPAPGPPSVGPAG